MIAYTPGPWMFTHRLEVDWSNRPIESRTWDISVGHDILATVGDQIHGTPVAEIAANARLIAAAPDLLAALKQVLANMDPYWKGDDEDDARALIAKIEGTP